MTDNVTEVETEDSTSGAADNGTVLTQDPAEGNTDAGATTETTDSGDTDGDQGGATDEGDQTSLETYADFSLPEGVTLDEGLLAEVTPIFKELGLSQEQAQKLVDFQAKQVQAGIQKQTDDFNQLMDDWKTQSQNDSEIGGDKFEENVAIARLAVNKFGTPGLQELMANHGIGNNVEMVRFMYKVGLTLKEDVPGTSNAVTPKKDRVSTLYPE